MSQRRALILQLFLKKTPISMFPWRYAEFGPKQNNKYKIIIADTDKRINTFNHNTPRSLNAREVFLKFMSSTFKEAAIRWLLYDSREIYRYFYCRFWVKFSWFNFYSNISTATTHKLVTCFLVYEKDFPLGNINSKLWQFS